MTFFANAARIVTLLRGHATLALRYTYINVTDTTNSGAGGVAGELWAQLHPTQNSLYWMTFIPPTPLSLSHSLCFYLGGKEMQCGTSVNSSHGQRNKSCSSWNTEQIKQEQNKTKSDSQRTHLWIQFLNESNIQRKCWTEASLTIEPMNSSVFAPFELRKDFEVSHFQVLNLYFSKCSWWYVFFSAALNASSLT